MQKKIIVKKFVDLRSNNTKESLVHSQPESWVLCKSSKNCANESKNRLTHKNSSFFGPFFKFFKFCPFFRQFSWKWKNGVIPNKVIEYQNGPDSLEFCHLSGLSMMLFGLWNKLILFSDHYQTHCSWVEIRLHAKNHLPRIFLLVGLKWCYIPKISFLDFFLGGGG